MRLVMPSLNEVAHGDWANVRQRLCDDLQRLCLTANKIFEVAHHPDGEQKASTRGQLLGEITGTFAEQPTKLTSSDDGLLFFVSDYGHLVRWNGPLQRWDFAPGDSGNGFFQHFAITPPTNGWALADGSTVNYLTVGGATLTTTSISLPNLTGGAYLRSGTYTGSVVGAGNTGSSGSHDHGGSTGSESSHTHGPGTLTGVTGIGNTLDGASSTGASFSKPDHTHVVTVTGGATGAGSSHSHSISSDGSHTHVTGEPTHLAAGIYFRL